MDWQKIERSGRAFLANLGDAEKEAMAESGVPHGAIRTTFPDLTPNEVEAVCGYVDRSIGYEPPELPTATEE